MSGFGISVRSFSPYSGETRKKRYLKETEGNFKKHLKETGEKSTFF